MVEEIKNWIDLQKDEDLIEISGKTLYKILDKYNNQPDFKGAFEELEKGFKNHTEGWLNYEDQSYMCSRFENLKKKYNLGGE